MECKKETIKEDVANTHFQEWTDDTLRLLGIEQPPRFEKDKLDPITAGIRAIVKDRDDACAEMTHLSSSLPGRSKRSTRRGEKLRGL
jgi:hypothetical protein